MSSGAKDAEVTAAKEKFKKAVEKGKGIEKEKKAPRRR